MLEFLSNVLSQENRLCKQIPQGPQDNPSLLPSHSHCLPCALKQMTPDRTRY